MKIPLACTLTCAASAAAQSATVVVEASRNGDRTNTTITVPLHQRFTDPALAAVSTLYLTGSEGVSLDSITCTPYRNTNLTGTGGLPFTSTKPSSLSTNLIQVGSLLCDSTESSSSSSSSSSTTSTSTSTFPTLSPPRVTNSTTRAPNVTSILLTTVSQPASSTAGPSTITSTAIFSGSDGPQTSVMTTIVGGEVTASATAPPSLNSEGAAPTAMLGDRSLFGAAVFGVGFLALL